MKTFLRILAAIVLSPLLLMIVLIIAPVFICKFVAATLDFVVEGTWNHDWSKL